MVCATSDVKRLIPLKVPPAEMWNEAVSAALQTESNHHLLAKVY